MNEEREVNSAYMSRAAFGPRSKWSEDIANLASKHNKYQVRSAPSESLEKQNCKEGA